MMLKPPGGCKGRGRLACFELQSGEGVPLASRGAHRRKAFETFLVALAPRGDAITQPVFLDGDLAIELMPRARFVFVCKVAPGFEPLAVPIPWPAKMGQ
jgi:hypothetical protein